METIISYFSAMPPQHRLLSIAIGILFFWLIESWQPLQKMAYNKGKHALINIFFTFTTIIVNFSLAFLLAKTTLFSTQNNWGLLQLLPAYNFWTTSFVGLLFMDFIGAFLPHFIQHKIPFLWRFHLVHHSDTWIDATSANRHHPGESVVRFLFTTLAVVIVGAPIWLLFLYQTLSVLLSQFNHANITISPKIDSILSYIIVSPNMHKVHHHFEMPYTDTNYGNIFSIWDRVFGTFATLNPSKIIYGIDTYPDLVTHNSLNNLLKMPFFEQKQKNK